METKFLNKMKALLFAVLLLSSINTFAQDMAVPPNLQAALFKKIFTFDKTLAAKGDFEVAVLSGSGSGDAMVKAFKDVGVNAKAFSGNQVPASASVVYLMPDVEPTKQVYASKGILSVTGSSFAVEDGKVSIGLGLENNKPKLIINATQLKAEGHELPMEVLKLAIVVK